MPKTRPRDMQLVLEMLPVMLPAWPDWPLEVFHRAVVGCQGGEKLHVVKRCFDVIQES